MTAGRSPLKLPFGLLEGRLYEPRQVDIGLACRCLCPSCGDRLIAKHGDSGKIRPHFAHAAGTACSAGFESAVHLAAKQLIEERRRLFFPEHRCQIRMWTGAQYLEAYEVLESAGLRDVADVEVEKVVGAVKPDLTLNFGDKRFIVEIAFTHFVDDDKLQKLRELGHPSLEFDISDLRELDFALLSERLFSWSAKARWLHHPETAVCESRLRAQLEPLVAAAQQKALAAQQARLEREARWETARVVRWASRDQPSESGDAAILKHLREVKRATDFAALPAHQKRERALTAMKLSRGEGSSIFGLKVRCARSIDAPLDVWQSALFAVNIDRCQQHQRPYLAVDHATSWLSSRFTLSDEFGKPQVAVWDYLQALAKVEVLEWKPRAGFLVMVVDAQAAIALATLHSSGGSSKLVWCVRDVSIKRRLRLAEAFAMEYGAGSRWRSLVSPKSIEMYNDPFDLMLESCVQHVPAAATRRFLIAAGYCRAG